MNEYELYHHGILGMKWGIRRFQNKDGSLTTSGKQRYSTDDGHTVKNFGKSLIGVYKEGDGNPYVSERRRKNRKAEIDEWNARKEKEKKRSDIRKDLERKAKEAGKEASKLKNQSDKLKEQSEQKISEQKQLKKESKAIRKHYVAGRVAAQSALTMLSSMAISMTNDKLYSGKIDSGTIVRGLMLGIASVPIVALRTGIEEGSAHREAEKKYGLRK